MLSDAGEIALKRVVAQTLLDSMNRKGKSAGKSRILYDKGDVDYIVSYGEYYNFTEGEVREMFEDLKDDPEACREIMKKGVDPFNDNDVQTALDDMARVFLKTRFCEAMSGGRLFEPEMSDSYGLNTQLAFEKPDVLAFDRPWWAWLEIHYEMDDVRQNAEKLLEIAREDEFAMYALNTWIEGIFGTKGAEAFKKKWSGSDFYDFGTLKQCVHEALALDLDTENADYNCIRYGAEMGKQNMDYDDVDLSIEINDEYNHMNVRAGTVTGAELAGDKKKVAEVFRKNLELKGYLPKAKEEIKPL